jgi:3-isopropylmalate/(R)-2-methylmalate dehydratase small subunit
LLPIVVSPDFLKILLSEIENNPETNIEVNLEKQTISIEKKSLTEHFEIDSYKKICMINGYDDIDFLINNKEKIVAYENNRSIIF